MKTKKPIIFCDFDGTITTKDSLVHILDLYGDPNWRDIEVRVQRGEIGSRVSIVEEFNTFYGSWDDVKQRLYSDIKIDSYFGVFLDFCKNKSLDFIILSGGFLSFINTILTKFEINEVPYHANTIKFKGTNATIEFPYHSKECHLCGHCKSQHLRKARENDYFPIIYIGDGTTDRCPAKEADILFAKDGLARYCTRKKIPFINWTTFSDIEAYLDKLPELNDKNN